MLFKYWEHFVTEEKFYKNITEEDSVLMEKYFTVERLLILNDTNSAEKIQSAGLVESILSVISKCTPSIASLAMKVFGK